MPFSTLGYGMTQPGDLRIVFILSPTPALQKALPPPHTHPPAPLDSCLESRENQ